jgi:hypothetical protein
MLHMSTGKASEPQRVTMIAAAGQDGMGLALGWLSKLLWFVPRHNVTVRALSGRLRFLSVLHSESVFYGSSVWARGR